MDLFNKHSKHFALFVGLKKVSKTLDIGVEIIKIKEHPTNTCALTTCLKIFTPQFFCPKSNGLLHWNLRYLRHIEKRKANSIFTELYIYIYIYIYILFELSVKRWKALHKQFPAQESYKILTWNCHRTLLLSFYRNMINGRSSRISTTVKITK